MAKIKLGAIVVAMSGKLGGHVFARNNGGAYMRTKTTPLNPQTVFQTAIRALFAQISTAWGALTASQRQSWRDAVDSFTRTDVFGDLKSPTGKALYQRLNMNLLDSDQAGLDVAPLPDAVTFADAQTADGAVGLATLVVTNNGDTTGDKVLIFATDKVSNGTKFVKNKLRKIEVIAGAAGVDFDIHTAYVARFSALVITDNIFIGIATVNSVGQRSPIQVLKVVIVA